MGKDKTLPLLDPREPPELTETKPASKVWAKEFRQESKRLWELAGPAIFTAISQYSLGALTQTFSGRIGELELAAVSVENSVISGLAFGVMVIPALMWGGTSSIGSVEAKRKFLALNGGYPWYGFVVSPLVLVLLSSVGEALGLRSNAVPWFETNGFS
ncbi:hypothetical protein F2Q69_00046236 [Brassica cretica]|uniref:Multidrug and toxic compound extrusion protein n=1 Tax=Brassica cretica TaxID=69181 RepID=A0A8S9PKN0_BRACR|nr:hypothetical protein F2Q69_00046236 [Brassica cretica]